MRPFLFLLQIIGVRPILLSYLKGQLGTGAARIDRGEGQRGLEGLLLAQVPSVAGRSLRQRRALRLVSQGLVVGPAPKHKWRGSVSLRYIRGFTGVCFRPFPWLSRGGRQNAGRRAVCCRASVQ